MRVSIDSDKYTYELHQDGRSEAWRYGETWRDVSGDKLIYCMAHEIEQLRATVQEQSAEIASLYEMNLAQAKTIAEQAAEIERLKTTPASLREDLRCVISDICQQARDEQHKVKVLTDALEAYTDEVTTMEEWLKMRHEALATVKGG